MYECICVESGLVLDDNCRLLLVAEDGDRHVPFTLPMRGTYDRGGRIDLPSKLDANAKAILDFAASALKFEAKLPKQPTLDGVLDELRADGPGGTWKKRAIRVSLVDDVVYTAIAKLVAENGPAAWRRYAQVGLDMPEPALPNRPKARAAKAGKLEPKARRLLETILGNPADEAARGVYVDLLLERDDPRGRLLALLPRVEAAPYDDLLAAAFPFTDAATTLYGGRGAAARFRPALVELIRFLAWGTRLAPSFGEGQFYGFTNKAERDDGYVKPYCARTRVKYAGIPALLAAVDVNEQGWRSRQSDD
ncbi:MAG: hypothetical protein ABI867_39320 [Kofleriaceae bacterium]